MDISGSRILITGASGGLGRSIAGTLAGRGARVVLSGRDIEALRDVQATVGGEMTPEEEEEFKAPIRAQYEEQGNPYYSTARLWDDGVIDPADTRTVLALALSATANAPVEPVSYGVFRM